jgi:hypothetical protein
MKALSIRPPWAWVIAHADKRIPRDEYEDFRDLTSYAVKSLIDATCNIPAFEESERGGIIGSVNTSDRRCFSGPYGFVLANQQPSPLRPDLGKLGFLDPNNADNHCREIMKIVKADAAQPDLFGADDD